MIGGIDRQPAASPLRAAIDSVDVAVERLIKLVDDGALSDLGAFGLVEMLAKTLSGSATSCRWWTGR